MFFFFSFSRENSILARKLFKWSISSSLSFSFFSPSASYHFITIFIDAWNLTRFVAMVIQERRDWLHLVDSVDDNYVSIQSRFFFFSRYRLFFVDMIKIFGSSRCFVVRYFLGGSFDSICNYRNVIIVSRFGKFH